jgi:hypothetical protein
VIDVGLGEAGVEEGVVFRLDTVLESMGTGTRDLNEQL